ncbi:MAG: type II secretion system protein [bacterium]
MILYSKFLNNKAFSLVEVVIVSLIIFALLLIAFYYYQVNIEYAKMAVFIQNSRFIKISSEKYYIDKGRYPCSLLELFSDPYKDYLPKSIAPNFIYSPWNGDVFIKVLERNYISELLLYAEYRFSGKNVIPFVIVRKIQKELYFYGYYSKDRRDYLIFLLSFVKK